MKTCHHKLLINIKWHMVIIHIGNLKYEYGHPFFNLFLIVQSSIPEILVTILDKRLTSES